MALFGHRSDDDEGLLLGAKRTCRLSFGQVSELSAPLDRELLEEIVELLVERVDLQPDGIDLRLQVEGLTSLCSELRGSAGAHQEAA